MSKENVEVVRRMWSHWKAGRLQEAAAALHPDVEWESTFQLPAQTFRGRQGVEEHARQWLGAWEEVEVEPEEFIETDEDRVLLLAVFRGRGRESGVPVEQPFAHLYEVHEGMVRSMREFLDRADALEAAGLSE